MRAVRELVTREGLTHVLLAARWSFYLDENNLSASDGPFASECRLDLPDTTPSPLFSGLERLINALPTVQTVWILRQVPKQSDHVSPRFLAVRLMQGESIDSLGVPLEEHRRHRRRADAMLDALVRCSATEVAFLDATESLCGDGHCRIARGGGSLYRDDDHLSTYGARAVAEAFEPFFLSVKASRAADAAEVAR